MLKKQTRETGQTNKQDTSIPDELKRLTDFFSILIAIDQRAINNTYVKTEK